MSEWQEYRLGDLGRVVTGKTPSKKNPEDWGNAMPFVTPTDYGGFNKRAAHTERYLSHVGISRLSQKILPPNSVMVTCIGSDMGKIAINTFPVITNQQINSIIPNTNLVSSDFLYYRLVSMYEILRAYGRSGTAVPIVNKGDFENLKAKMPPLCEQEAIAAVLSSLDDKIDLLRRQNGTLESLAQALFRHWFVDGAAGDWEEGCLGDIADNVRDSISHERIPNGTLYVGLEHIDKKSIALYRHGLSDDVQSNKYQFAEGDILFGKLRPYFHKVCFTPFSGVCSTDILVLRPKDLCYFCFSLFAFFQDDVVEYANLGSGGTRMPRTNWETLQQYPLQIPPVERIQEFNELVYPSIEKIKHNLMQIRTLEKLRDTLLPKLMSGEVRVRL